MKKPKLTDEELSRVLGQAAIGKLVYWTYGRSSSDDTDQECGCIAGAAIALGCERWEAEEHGLISANEASRAMEISDVAGIFEIPDGPDRALRLLEARGLA